MHLTDATDTSGLEKCLMKTEVKIEFIYHSPPSGLKFYLVQKSLSQFSTS